MGTGSVLFEAEPAHEGLDRLPVGLDGLLAPIGLSRHEPVVPESNLGVAQRKDRRARGLEPAVEDELPLPVLERVPRFHVLAKGLAHVSSCST